MKEKNTISKNCAHVHPVAAGKAPPHDPLQNLNATVSGTECTGLMPALEDDIEKEADNYGKLYDIHPPKAPD